MKQTCGGQSGGYAVQDRLDISHRVRGHFYSPVCRKEAVNSQDKGEGPFGNKTPKIMRRRPVAGHFGYMNERCSSPIASLQKGTSLFPALRPCLHLPSHTPPDVFIRNSVPRPVSSTSNPCCPPQSVSRSPRFWTVPVTCLHASRPCARPQFQTLLSLALVASPHRKHCLLSFLLFPSSNPFSFFPSFFFLEDSFILPEALMPPALIKFSDLCWLHP